MEGEVESTMIEELFEEFLFGISVFLSGTGGGEEDAELSKRITLLESDEPPKVSSGIYPGEGNDRLVIHFFLLFVLQ